MWDQTTSSGRAMSSSQRRTSRSASTGPRSQLPENRAAATSRTASRRHPREHRRAVSPLPHRTRECRTRPASHGRPEGALRGGVDHCDATLWLGRCGESLRSLWEAVRRPSEVPRSDSRIRAVLWGQCTIAVAVLADTLAVAVELIKRVPSVR